MRWTERLTAACMVATIAVAVFYNERNYRLSLRNAELSERNAEATAEHLRLARDAAARQAEADGFVQRVRERHAKENP